MATPVQTDNPILQRAAEHLQEQGIKTIEVPEWGEEGEGPLVIHARPVTLEDRRKCIARNKDDQMGQLAELVILKALDADLKPLFKRTDKTFMMRRTDDVVLSRIADEIMGEAFEDPETGDRIEPLEHAAKNLRTIPSSA